MVLGLKPFAAIWIDPGVQWGDGSRCCASGKAAPAASNQAAWYCRTPSGNKLMALPLGAALGVNKCLRGLAYRILAITRLVSVSIAVAISPFSKAT